jgi:hypothetical protein
VKITAWCATAPLPSLFLLLRDQRGGRISAAEGGPFTLSLAINAFAT